MKGFRLDRRTILRGAGGAAVALPFLEAMAPGRKAYAASPKRLVVFFSPNGTIFKDWRCDAKSPTDFPLSRILKPLEPLRNKMVFIEGLNQGKNGVIPGPGDDHMRGMAWMLTGRPLMAGIHKGNDDSPPAGLASGPSIDQEIATKIGGGTRRKSLEFGVKSTFLPGNPLGYMVYAGQNEALTPMQEPSRAFFDVFGDFSAPTPEKPANENLVADRKSVVDAVKASFDSLAKKVGAADRIKLDKHLANIREIETRVTAVPMQGCQVPPAPREDLDIYDEANYEEAGKLNQKILVHALSCGLTRVASMQWSRSAGGPVFKQFGATRNHHDVSHDGPTVAESQEILTKINVFYAQRFIELVTEMDQIVESDGKTLLDNSLVMWVNELAVGNVHTHAPLCYVLAGGAGGALQGNRYLRINEPHNNLLVSVLNLMGVEANSFGEPGFSTGPLRGL